MPEQRRRRATQRSAATPIGPKGCGGMAPPSLLPLLGDGGTSPSSRRLESGPMAYATDDAGAPGRALRARRRTRQYVEHPEARKHRWVRYIDGRSRKLVGYAG